MTPLRYAVRLVDGEQRNLRSPELRDEALVVEALGGDVEKLHAAVPKPLRDVTRVVRAQAGVEPCGTDALADQRVDLVLHQRDQRRDDDREAVEQHCRQLVAEALAGPRREHGQRRAPREQCLDDLPLTGAKGIVPEPSAEDFECLGRPIGPCFHPWQRSTGRTTSDTIPLVAHLELIDPEDADGLLAEEYEAAIGRAGKVFNIVRSMSLNPEVLRASIEMYRAIMFGPSGLTRQERELLATVVSAENECYY